MKYEPADVFFVAGEASGDLQASLLASAARKLHPGLTLAGIGGERLRQAGAKISYESPELASIGPLSILPKIPMLYIVLRWLEAAMRRRPPRLFVPVDAGAVNLTLVRWLRKGGYGGPIVYYFPPGAWLDNLEQARAVAALTVPLTPFAHQRDFYARNGLRVAYFGHPLVSVIPPRSTQPSSQAPLIAVLPGSRREEIEHHVPTLARTARELGRIVGVSFVAVAASPSLANRIETLWSRSGGPGSLTIAQTSAVRALQSANVAWVASGTAVLEAALVKVPQIAFYVLSTLQRRIAGRRLPPHLLHRVTLPNLVMEREIIPELLQERFTVPNLVDLTTSLLEREALRREQLEAYDSLRAALGPADTLAQIAGFVVDQLEERAAS